MAYMNKMLIPLSDIVSAFDRQVKPLADKMKHNDDQSHTLATIRDALLPKLLSGEIRVKDAEKFLINSI
jgi:type I restriction enzyme S subunit